MIMIMMVHVGINIYPKFIPKIFPYTSSPNFTGKMVDAFWNVMDSEDYNVYNVWIRRVSEALENEVTTTRPCQQHGRPNELKLHT